MKMAVKLGPYKYPAYLKELATGRLDDTKILSPTAKQNLHSVKYVSSDISNIAVWADRRRHITNEETKWPVTLQVGYREFFRELCINSRLE